MPHMLEAGVILHSHHGMLGRRCAPLIPCLIATLFIFVIAPSSSLICEVRWPFVLVRAAILYPCQPVVSPWYFYTERIRIGTAR